MGQIIKSLLSHFLSHCHSVCKHSYGHNFDSILIKFCTVIRGLKSKIKFVWDKNVMTPSPILPQFLKICITAYGDFKAVSVLVKDNCVLFAPTPYFRARAIRRNHLNFSPDDPCCHGNEFWDKIDYNSAPVKDNRSLFAPTPYFRARAIRRCYLNFSPDDPCCHGNEFWDKIDYNSAPVKDNRSLFAPTPYFWARTI